MTRAATTAGQGKRANERERLDAEQRANDVTEVMGTEAGRRFVWRLLGDCGLYRSSYHPSALIHFNEGQRSIGLQLLSEITSTCPAQYLVMQGEAIAEQQRAAQRAMVDETRIDEEDHDD